MLVTVDGDRAVKVRGDPEHPNTAGFLCAKVNRYLDRTYSPDRLLSPLRRVGPKGSGRFEPIGWDEALNLVAERLKALADRPQAILPYSYSGTLGLIQNGSMDHRFFHRLGASQLDRTICSTCGSETLDQVLGARLGPEMGAFEHARTIFAWGTNTLTSNVHLWPAIERARAEGGQLVVIDPVRTRTAERADRWVPIRPGSDAALAYGLMRVVLDAGWEDASYLRHHTRGAERLMDTIRRDWTLDRAARSSGVDPEVIEELAHRFVHHRPAAVRLNYGLQRHAGGGAAVKAILSFVTLVGAWRDTGGGALLSTSGAYPVDTQRLARPDLMPDPPPRVVNMSRLGEALDPSFDPAVECLFVYASNPAAVAPDQEAVLRGLARDDLFTVVHEIFMTDTARYADVVLPATTQLEQLDIHKSYGHYDVLLNQPSIAPLGEAVSNTELFRRLATRLGFDEACFRDDDESLVEQAFRWNDPRMAGITVDRLREGPQRLSIPDAPLAAPERPIELDPGPGDGFVPPAELDRDPRHPLALISPPAHHFLNSSFVNLDFARSREGEPTLLMHGDDAADRNLRPGTLVRIFNRRGEFRARLEVTEGLQPGVVCAPSIWWLSLDGQPPRRNANAVTSQRLTDVGRGATFYDCAVEVEAVV
jgi:anaerobic selenocysteine-containing dehydrogenase